MTPWEIHGREMVSCNCAYGCPCQFNAPPTDGTCEAAVAYIIDRGHHGETDLSGMRCGLIAKWPGAIHEGDGVMQMLVDSRASPAQQEAMLKLMSGEDSEEMATMWWIFSAMAPTKLAPVRAPLDVEIDVAARRGRAVAEGFYEVTGEPIRNPVTGAEHRARIDLPYGFEYRLAEMGSTNAVTHGELKLEKNRDSYGQFAELHLGPSGVIAAPAGVAAA
ncbi:MAG: DUF1326 domain-containing protein [Pseudomonadota bacterium]